MSVFSAGRTGLVLVALCLSLAACKSSEERAEAYYQEGLALLESGDIDRAIVQFRNVFQLDGSHREARLTLAETLYGQRKFQQAYSQYLRLAEQYPEDLETRIALSGIAFEAGLWDEVERHGAKAEELAPEDPRVQAITAVRAYRAAALDKDEPARREAARQVETLLESQPDSTLLRGIAIDAALREGDFASALEGIDALIAQNPDNPRYHDQRLQVLAQTGDTEAVEAQLRDMIARFPEETGPKTTLVRLYLSQQDIDAAEAFLRELEAASAPEDPGPMLDLIRFLAELRSPEAARAEIDRAIAERPDPVPFQVIGAGLDFTAGRQAEAVAALEALLDSAEPSEQTRNIKVSLAKMLASMGNEVGARTRIEEVLAEEPDNVEALKMQAAWRIEADDTDGALAALRTALDNAPEDAEAMTLMSQAYTRAGQPELAREFLALAVEASNNAPTETLRYARLLIGEERYLPAEDLLIKALRLAPDNRDLLTMLGDLYLRMEDYGRTENVAAALRRLGGEQNELAANQLDAERLNRQSGTEEALSFLENVAGAGDATLASRLSLVRARLATGDAEGALNLARQMQQDDPDNPALDVVLATTLAVTGDLAGAEAIYREMLAEDPARPRLWLELSGLELRQGDRDAARAAIAEGLRHTPEDIRLQLTQASFLEQDGDVEGAIAIYEDLYARNSGTAVVANNLASLISTYRTDEASLERAWTIARRFRDTEIPALQDTYGWILHRRGDSAGALPYLEAAAEGLPAEPLVQYHLGQIYLALERPDAARAQMLRAVEAAGPGDRRPQIEEARRLLQSLPASGAGSAANGD